MSAVILAFPAPSTIRALTRVSDGSAPFAPAWCAQHLPLVDSAMELLAADDAEFGRRCAVMRDEDGRAMLGELAGLLQRLGAAYCRRCGRGFYGQALRSADRAAEPAVELVGVVASACRRRATSTGATVRSSPREPRGPLPPGGSRRGRLRCAPFVFRA